MEFKAINLLLIYLQAKNAKYSARVANRVAWSSGARELHADVDFYDIQCLALRGGGSWFCDGLFSFRMA